ncbi:hypothetical protein [Rhodoferax aquaticus]|uniref:Uncharacterized protein n=1 Tax=Rhodoferax aquaticus TaxID=2527691 RepID=A0A515EQQ4_9BURK|nr:hypothetical protein [Rhodoferax aquaticus]QDL54986.1 hypothetical protein EXZ61_12885 [Rhodoferax aquaticus]
MTIDVVTLAFAFAFGRYPRLVEPSATSLTPLRKGKKDSRLDMSDAVAYSMVRHWPGYEHDVKFNRTEDCYVWRFHRHAHEVDQEQHKVETMFFSNFDLESVQEYRQEVEQWAAQSDYKPKVAEASLFDCCKAMIVAYQADRKRLALEEEQKQLEMRAASMVFPPALGTTESNVWLTAQKGHDFTVDRPGKHSFSHSKRYPCSIEKVKEALKDPELFVFEFEVSELDGDLCAYRCVFRRVNDTSVSPKSPADFNYYAPSLKSLGLKDVKAGKKKVPRK